MNPYLLPAALIAAGLDGITQKRDPGPRYDTNSYVDGVPDTVRKLPPNLLDALRCLEANDILPNALGYSFTNAYLKLKHQVWNEYSAHISSWEVENMLDC